MRTTAPVNSAAEHGDSIRDGIDPQLNTTQRSGLARAANPYVQVGAATTGRILGLKWFYIQSAPSHTHMQPILHYIH
jgi:hypothetical protein